MAWKLNRPPKSVERDKKVRELEEDKIPQYVELASQVYHHRYLTSEQVARLFGIHPRTARYRLKQLFNHRHVGVLPVRHASPNSPHVYFVTGAGLTWLAKNRSGFDGFREDTRAAGKTYDAVMHELLSSEVQISLELTAAKLGLETSYTERRYKNPDRQLRWLFQGKEAVLEPDGGLLFANSNKRLPLFFLEFDADTETDKTLAQKVVDYARWWWSLEGYKFLCDFYFKQGYGVIPVTNGDESPPIRLLFVLHRGPRLSTTAETIRLMKVLAKAKEQHESFRKMIWLTEASQIERVFKEGKDLTEPIWLRPFGDEGKRHALFKS